MRTLTGTLLVWMAVGLVSCQGGEPDPGTYPLIPFPEELEVEGGSFYVDGDTRVVLVPFDDQGLRGVVDRWARDARASTGLSLPVVSGGGEESRNAILVRLRRDEDGSGAPAVPAGEGLPGTAAESYEMEVRGNRVTLDAEALPGIFYGLETLNQLLAPRGGGSRDPSRFQPRISTTSPGSGSGGCTWTWGGTSSRSPSSSGTWTSWQPTR